MSDRPSWISDIKAVGWDLDGTLYPPGSIPKEVISQLQYKKVMEINGWDRTKTQKEYDRLYAQLGSHRHTLKALGLKWVTFFVDLWDTLALENYIKPDKKVVSMIKEIKSLGLRQFVLSNSNLEGQIERKLRLIGIQPKEFDFLVSTVGLGAVKPDPKPFLVALERLRLQAGEVLFVGDREQTDILGGKRVGMRTCMVWVRSDLADVARPTVYDVIKLF